MTTKGMYNFNFISGTQKVLRAQPFLSMDYGTVSERLELST